MRLSTKIYLGFGTVMTVAIILGAMAVWNMWGIKTEANMLAEEYVPEVTVANNVERWSLKTMFEMRGYGFTEEESYLKKAKENLTKVEAYLKEADELAQKSAHLKKLKDEVKVAQTAVDSYKELVEKTEDLNKSLDNDRKTLDTSAKSYMDNCNLFLSSQEKRLEEEIKKNAANKALEERAFKISEVNSIIGLGNITRIAVWKAQSQRNPDVLTEAFKNFDEMGKKFDSLKAITRDPANMEQLKNTVAAGNSYKDAMKSLLNHWQELQSLNTKRNEVANQVLEAAQTTALAGITQTNEISKSSANTASSSLFILMVGLSIGAIIALILSVAITRGITTALNKSTDSLRIGAGEIATASNQLSAAAQQLSSMSAEQASSIEETAASLEEMNGMIKRNVGNAEEAVDLSNKVEQVSHQGNESMDKLKVSMEEILESNKKIEELVRVISDIGEKTQVMDEIVFQTKLLSFNASVEAERAGEHGRGFAVVAQEVGNLAQMSGKSAQEIAAIVTESIKNAQVITQENKKRVEQGSQYAVDVGNFLKDIMQSASTVHKGSEQVLTASKEQSQGIDQVNTAMTQLDKATQQNAATAEETAATSEELASQVAGVNKVIDELVRLVNGNQANPPPTNYESTRTIHREENKVVPFRGKKPTPHAPPMKRAVGDSTPTPTDSWEKI